MTLASDLIMVDTEVRDLGEPTGRAVFAAQRIETDQIVAVFGGAAVTAADLRELPEHMRQHSLQVEDGVYLVTSEHLTAATLINHSCDPNCRFDGSIVLRATRDIEVGDELTFDYAMCDSSPYDEFECRCGTALCRGKVTGDDWMRPELQDRYREWFSTYLTRKISELRALDADASSELVSRPSPR